MRIPFRALTPGLTLDLTLNPDFGQAEADEQQVNLTQFSQCFPEKRDFFLENSGVFYVGYAARNNRVNPTPTPDEDNLLFFSRRIGLSSSGLPIPINGGVRLTGKLTESTRLGVLSISERGDELNPRAIETAFPTNTVQTCIVHLLRNSLDYASWKDRKKLAAALRPIYTAVSAEVAEAALRDVAAGPWGQKHPTIVQSWQRTWAQVIPFFAFPRPCGA